MNTRSLSMQATRRPDPTGVETSKKRLERLISEEKREGRDIESLAAMFELLQLETSRLGSEGSKMPGLEAFNRMVRAWSHLITEPKPSEHYVRNNFELAANHLLAYARGETELV